MDASKLILLFAHALVCQDPPADKTNQQSSTSLVQILETPLESHGTVISRNRSKHTVLCLRSQSVQNGYLILVRLFAAVCNHLAIQWRRKMIFYRGAPNGRPEYSRNYRNRAAFTRTSKRRPGNEASFVLQTLALQSIRRIK